MNGPAFFITHVSKHKKHPFDRVHGLGYKDIMDFVFSIADPERDKDMDLICGFVPEAVANGDIGFTIASSEMAKKLRPIAPMPKQEYSKYFNGSLPHHTKDWHVCDNCGAYCQGDVWPGGCNMCNGVDNEISPCDCEVVGGEESAKTCPMHSEYGVLNTEFPSDWVIMPEFLKKEENPSGWDLDKVSVSQQWLEKIKKEALRNTALGENTWKSKSPSSSRMSQKAFYDMLNEKPTQVMKDSLPNSSKGTSGKLLYSQLYKRMAIGAPFILFASALIGTFGVTTRMPTTFSLAAVLIIVKMIRGQ